MEFRLWQESWEKVLINYQLESGNLGKNQWSTLDRYTRTFLADDGRWIQRLRKVGMIGWV